MAEELERKKERKKDWIGNSKSIYVTLGSSNHVEEERAENDLYCTSPKAIEIWLNEIKPRLSDTILEPSAGLGHISEVLKAHGYKVISKDLVQRTYPLDSVEDFLQCTEWNPYTVVMNPPYNQACAFVKKAIEISEPGTDIWAFLKIQFLEGKERRKELFDNGWLQEVDVYTSRVLCAKNGDFETIKSSAVAYCMMRFNSEKCDNPIIRWIN